MLLTEIPLMFALIGLVLYTVLAGADFGAGVWQATAESGPQAARVRDHAHNAIAPVWEANHVWLIFVITVMWTAYPVAFGSIASTLTVPLFLAALGIVLRGLAYVLHADAADSRELRTIDAVFSLSSVLTPFALGTVVGGIASRRVPVGNAAGSLVSSWLNPIRTGRAGDAGAGRGLALRSGPLHRRTGGGRDYRRLGAGPAPGLVGRDPLIAVVVAVLAGAILLFPALGLLFRPVLAGRFDPGASAPRSGLAASRRRRARHSRPLARVAGACLVAGFGLLTVAEAGWAHAVGVVCLLGAVASGFFAATPATIADEPSAEDAQG